jgi:hypothetical protein
MTAEKFSNTVGVQTPAAIPNPSTDALIFQKKVFVQAR